MTPTRPRGVSCSPSAGDPAGPGEGAPPEDESADPVGDGCSDAEFAERHAPDEPVPEPIAEKKPA